MQIVHSYWSPERPSQTQRPLAERTSCDVVVIGGGVNGLSAAYELARAGMKVVLLERNTVGSQSSTKNFGVLTSLWAYHGCSPAERQRLARFSARIEGVGMKALSTPVMRGVLNRVMHGQKN